MQGDETVTQRLKNLSSRPFEELSFLIITVQMLNVSWVKGETSCKHLKELIRNNMSYTLKNRVLNGAWVEMKRTKNFRG